MDITEYAPSYKQWSSLTQDIKEGYARFWRKDQISGFDENGIPIRTGVPRPNPTWQDEFSVFPDNTTESRAPRGSEVDSEKPKRSG